MITTFDLRAPGCISHPSVAHRNPSISGRFWVHASRPGGCGDVASRRFNFEALEDGCDGTD